MYFEPASAGRRIRHGACTSANAGEPAMERFRNIVAAIDFSETSGEVVRTALALVRDDGHVCLLHAVPHAIQTPWVVDASGVDVDDLQCQWVAEAETQLITSPPPCAWIRAGCRSKSSSGRRPSRIVRRAAERGADLLVRGLARARRHPALPARERRRARAARGGLPGDDRAGPRPPRHRRGVAHPARRGIGRRRVGAPSHGALTTRSAGSRRGRGAAPPGSPGARSTSAPRRARAA